MAQREPIWIIGWREWVALPDFNVDAIKAKIDTGARSSALHAFNLKRFRRRGKRMVRFEIHPIQRTSRQAVEVEAEVIEDRMVRSSNGKVERRPVIRTSVRMYNRDWEIELTLTSRDEMGFRMLLGRHALRGQFLIDPGRSLRAGYPVNKKT
ncbi:MAG: ATP-dependent zinc protease [Candidatus Latescibacteria bacterium]|nr:ATP-dependent zinc protease [Candidatus Latescibacterota bacterium]